MQIVQSYSLGGINVHPYVIEWFFETYKNPPRMASWSVLPFLQGSLYAQHTHTHTDYRKKVAHTQLPSICFRSWSQFLAVSLQVTWVINLAVGCYYFPPGLQLPSRAATNFAAWWTEARWVWTVCLRRLPDSVEAAIWTQALLRWSPAR